MGEPVRMPNGQWVDSVTGAPSAAPFSQAADAAAQNAPTPTGPPMAQPQAGPPPASIAAPSVQLTAPPAAQTAPGEGPPPDQSDAMLARILAPNAGVGVGRRVGLSPADKQYGQFLQDQAGQIQNQLGDVAQRSQDVADKFGQQTDILANESGVATDAMKQEMADNAAHRQRLAADADAKQARIDAQISQLQAQGVDPNRYWQNMSTPQKIGAGFAVALGAIGAHALGPRGSESQNAALGIINSAIAQDIEAQKANMQGQLELLGKKMNWTAQGFDRQSAELNAERDSIQTAHSVAIADIQRRASMYQQNAAVQSEANKLIAGVRESGAQQVQKLNGDIYQLNKNSERVVAPNAANDIAKQVRDLSLKLQDQADERGIQRTPEDANRMAMKRITGEDIKPGQPMPSFAANPKGGTAAGRLGRLKVNYQASLDAIDQAMPLSDKIFLSPAENGKLASTLNQVHSDIGPGVPEGTESGGMFSPGRVAGGLKARLATARASIQKKLETVNQIMAKPGAAADEEEPEGLKSDDVE